MARKTSFEFRGPGPGTREFHLSFAWSPDQPGDGVADSAESWVRLGPAARAGTSAAASTAGHLGHLGEAAVELRLWKKPPRGAWANGLALSLAATPLSAETGSLHAC